MRRFSARAAEPAAALRQNVEVWRRSDIHRMHAHVRVGEHTGHRPRKNAMDTQNKALRLWGKDFQGGKRTGVLVAKKVA
jgi:hypothetical protein